MVRRWDEDEFARMRLWAVRRKSAPGYAPTALGQWAERAKIWAGGGEPGDLPRIDKATKKSKPRDVFIYFINGAKERAPAAARELLSLMATKA